MPYAEPDGEKKYSEAAMNQKYMMAGCVRCPKCNSDQLEEEGPWEAEGNCVTKPILCLNCGATWDDLYRLACLINFEADVDEEPTEEDIG